MIHRALRDTIGQRGEALFFVILTKLYGRARPLFKPQFLGDKWPTVDFIVELIDSSSTVVPYFFVQVKTTQQGYTKKYRCLKIQVSARDARRLASFPAPTYVVGIDEINESAYITSTSRGSVRFPQRSKNLCEAKKQPENPQVFTKDEI